MEHFILYAVCLGEDYGKFIFFWIIKNFDKERANVFCKLHVSLLCKLH